MRTKLNIFCEKTYISPKLRKHVTSTHEKFDKNIYVKDVISILEKKTMMKQDLLHLLRRRKVISSVGWAVP